MWSRGLADERLLDSYSSERVRGCTREPSAHGTKSTEFMAPPSFAFGLMRTAVLGLAARHEGVRSLINPRQSFRHHLRGFAAECAGFGKCLLERRGRRRGAVLPECPLTVWRDGCVTQGHLTDLVGPGFGLLHFSRDGRPGAAVEDFLRTMQDRDVPLQLVRLCQFPPGEGPGVSAQDHTGRLFGLYGAGPGSIYLVRPDGHVIGRWQAPDAATLTSAIEHVLHPAGPAIERKTA